VDRENPKSGIFSRHALLKWALIILSALIILLAIVISPVALFPFFGAYPRTAEDIIETSCDRSNTAGKKVLVAYDTKHGGSCRSLTATFSLT
jgi:hypothetical protein